MNSVGSPLGLSGVLALRARILERSNAISEAVQSLGKTPAGEGEKGGFTSTMAEALRSVNALDTEARAQATSWERGETSDIAGVMLARQKANVAFEATMQVRNRLLSAYRDIMNMPV